MAGQVTAEHELVKKRLVVDAATDPAWLALHEHPPRTLALLGFAGQATAEHELARKGLLVEAVIETKKPDLCEQ